MSKPVTPIAVEVIREKKHPSDLVTQVVADLVVTPALTALLAWWFFASWFPHLGITWWALVLPVLLVRFLFGRAPVAFWREVDHGQVRR